MKKSFICDTKTRKETFSATWNTALGKETKHSEA